MDGVKLLIVAKEASGKTTLVSTLKDALVVSTDNKAFTGKVPHFRYSEYTGLEDLTSTINEKLSIYQQKYKKLPNTLVIDSVTHLANNMERYANEKFTGFNIWSALGKDILGFNHYLETVVIPSGMNVVLTSHCQFNKDTGRYEIASPGSFGKNGSWLSVTDNSIFIEIKSNKRIVHTSSLKFPARTNIEASEPIDIDKYDINTHIQLLEKAKGIAEEFVL